MWLLPVQPIPPHGAPKCEVVGDLEQPACDERQRDPAGCEECAADRRTDGCSKAPGHRSETRRSGTLGRRHDSHHVGRQVRKVADETGAVPYDVPGVEMTHVGEFCSFDAFLKKHQLDAPALHRLAVIVRGADTSCLDLTPESAGLYAISQGLSQNFANDHEMLRHGLVMYDALYAWCQSRQAQTNT